MPNDVKTCWLHDKEGKRIAPKTLTSQVQTNDGILLENKIKKDIEDVLSETLILYCGNSTEITD